MLATVAMPRTSSLSDSSFEGRCTAPQGCRLFFLELNTIGLLFKLAIRSQFRLRSHFSKNFVKFIKAEKQQMEYLDDNLRRNVSEVRVVATIG